MNWWFLVFLVIQILGLGIHLGKHGEKDTVKYNFWLRLIVDLIMVFIVYKAIQTGF